PPRTGPRVCPDPRALISAVADFVPVRGDDSCCGAAGTYSLLRPRDSKRILAPKLAAYEAAGVDYVVTVNPGCQRQLHGNLRRRESAIRAVHLADLLPPAHAGPAPPPGAPHAGGAGR